jgi:hypothetical protein
LNSPTGENYRGHQAQHPHGAKFRQRPRHGLPAHLTHHRRCHRSARPKCEETEGKAPAKDKQTRPARKTKAALQKQITALNAPTTEIMRELPEPRMSAIFKRGVYTDPADKVTPTVPAIFNSQPKGPPNRITLAKWLTSRDNPLAARVTVNRWWAEFFGQGIVSTLEDFGIKGAPPSHPELLDWLAVEFMESGWNMKHVLKKIVMSARIGRAVRFMIYD